MEDVLMSGTTPTEVMVQPGVNFTPTGKINVTLLEWARLRVWGPVVRKVGARMVKVVPASARR
jgi:hypothetical protein